MASERRRSSGPEDGRRCQGHWETHAGNQMQRYIKLNRNSSGLQTIKCAWGFYADYNLGFYGAVRTWGLHKSRLLFTNLTERYYSGHEILIVQRGDDGGIPCGLYKVS